MNSKKLRGETKLTPAALEVAGVSKSFGPVHALQNVSLRFEAGRITVLLGENGAGKSTLVRLCSGIMRPDTGSIILGGNSVSWNGPLDGARAGVAVVNQEPQLVAELTVADNIFLRELSDRSGFAPANRSTKVNKAILLLDRLGMTPYLPHPSTICRNLSAAERQMVDIVRALSHNPKVLFLDEPNSSLTHLETKRLFSVLENMRASNVAVVLVSHRLAEVYAISDHVVVLRDGRFIAEGTTDEIPLARAVELMAGELKTAQVTGFKRRIREVTGEYALELWSLSGDGYRDVTFGVRPGEVVGMAGLVGSGRSEIAAGIIGLTPIASGRLTIFGRPALPRNPRHALRLGIAYVAEERRTEIFHGQNIAYNLTARIIDELSRFGFVQPGSRARRAHQLSSSFGVKTSSVDAPITSLSGGNQQKVLLARALAPKPRVLILDEPTRGVDVGTKVEIYALLRQLARTENLAVLFISSEMGEILELADRIIVVRYGNIVRDAPNTSDPKPILAAAMGSNES